MEIGKQDIIIWKKKILLILDFIIKICNEYNLTYFLCGGTALGAIRHKGFIPWDDDIDIFMPRPDYQRFQDILIKMNNPDYEFLSYETTTFYIQPMGKVSDKHTTLLELDSQNYVEGLYVDVFPLDGCSDLFEEYKKDMVRYQHLYLKMQVLNEPMNRRVIKSILRMFKNRNYYFCRYLPYYFIRPFLRRNSILSDLRSIENSYSYIDANHVACYSGSYKDKEYFFKEWFGSGLKMTFEGLDVVLPQNYDAYLSRIYGDYMKLPPAEKQVSHHFVAYYNLNERLSLEKARERIE